MKTHFFVLGFATSALFSNPFLMPKALASGSLTQSISSANAVDTRRDEAFILAQDAAKAVTAGVNGVQGRSPASESPAATETCHALKFDSYFVAGNVKDNIKSVNPDLTHPNFAHHLLLLRAELSMENLYLIADCATGEFFHEKLSYDFAKFSKDSNQVELKTKKGETTVFEWDGKSWIKGETSAEATPDHGNSAGMTDAKSTPVTPPPSANSTPSKALTAAYEELFSKYPSEAGKETCAKPQYASYFRAQNAKDSIPKLNPDLTHPNFAGSKLLIRTETLFEKVYLLADCTTGKFTDDFLTGDLNFHPGSRLVVIKSSNNVPQLKIWSDAQWIQIPDPVQGGKKTIKNTLYGEKATLLVKNIPNPDRKDILRFEGLKRTNATDKLFQDLGADVIQSGVCRIPHGKSPECDVEVQ